MWRHTVVALVVALCVSLTLGAHSIVTYGAVANDPSNHAAWTNSAAITKAIMAANASTTGDRSVLVPSGSDFYIFEVEAYHLSDVTIIIDGTLLVSNNITAWPTSNPHHRLSALFIGQSSDVTIRGSGVVDGQGYDWWWYVIVTTIDNRPCLFVTDQVTGLEISGVLWKNSPYYHMWIGDTVDVHIHHIDIRVDVTKQKELLQEFHLLDEFEIPVFPLNTDGIDLAAKNVVVEHVRIENFDDAVAIKPLTGANVLSNCSQDMIIRNSEVSFGVGLTIGSVPPNANVNCVQNITFDNIKMHHPIKAIYVKTNPGDSGSGLIKNVTYSNIHGDRSLWYPIWIGPQQQRQPGTVGTGCSFFYPIVDKCPTQPRVPITQMRLINITMENGLLMPGVLLCNETKPCTEFEVTNVSNSGRFLVQDSYVCQNVLGTATNSTPTPGCLTASSGSGIPTLPSSASEEEAEQLFRSWFRSMRGG